MIRRVLVAEKEVGPRSDAGNLQRAGKAPEQLRLSATEPELPSESGYAATATEAPLVRMATAFWISSKSNGFDIIMSTPNSS